MIFVFAVVYLDVPALQIIILVLTNKFYLMYVVYAKPFAIKLFTRQEIFNEITIMLISYLCICQTDFVEHATAKFNVGYAMDAIIGLNILTLLLPVIYEAFRNLK